MARFADDSNVDIAAGRLLDEDVAVARLRASPLGVVDAGAVTREARSLIEAVRARGGERGPLRTLIEHYDLSTPEGVILMCLAEALLRIPDAATVDALIGDRLSAGDWQRHLGAGDTWLVDAATWSLMLGARVQAADEARRGAPFERLLARLGAPLLRTALRRAMGLMAATYVMGPTIEAALVRSRDCAFAGCRISFDMLGEAALGEPDAARFAAAYLAAIEAVGANVASTLPASQRDGISVKLSALHPRFEAAQRAIVVPELARRLRHLAAAAREAGVALTVDAEESARLALTLEVFAQVYRDPACAGWDGLGIAVQAYQKCAPAVIAWLARLAAAGARTIPVRLVKGAYWDTEIKHAQASGLDDFPVYTRKRNTDFAYLVCAQALFDHAPQLYPQLATHNAHTLSWACSVARGRAFETQRLHGMGEALYACLAERVTAPPCRVYAPVGAHAELLPYLVRRLLENGANSSFVNRLHDAALPAAELAADPAAQVAADAPLHRNPAVARPSLVTGPARVRAPALDFARDDALVPFFDALAALRAEPPRAPPRVDGTPCAGRTREVFDPAHDATCIGVVADADASIAARALDVAAGFFPDWNARGAAARATLLERAADAFVTALPELVALTVLEAGKTLADAHEDVREAIDFLRYYAAVVRLGHAGEVALPGPAGERNRLRLRGRGVFVCISPWNFPVAIFTGQVAAALVTGNTVIAKPAEQTSLVAHRVTGLLHAAGIPAAALACLPGDGATLGAALLDDTRVAGVAFTGSTATARAIARRLAAREGPLAVLVAETGGINALIADSTALAEQLVVDCTVSAFGAAGQRCSALRLLCVQDDVAPRVLELLRAHVETRVIGPPAARETDIGPLIDGDAHAAVAAHVAACRAAGHAVWQAPCRARDGHFHPPTIIELDRAGDLAHEVFGPVLHVVRFRADELEALVEDINALGYGLTLGVHSRIEARAQAIAAQARVGNVYINRDMVGAVVGMQPFGGMGLSGTGPKAGGPYYLARFAVEQVVSDNTAAIGGNAALLGAAG
ncbi:MAG: bifunctional proline dehydrogenase/L-glutamate gamma-semialdehyde dehydrogenase PutA [Gammaproteobacteria bacterium]